MESFRFFAVALLFAFDTVALATQDCLLAQANLARFHQGLAQGEKALLRSRPDEHKTLEAVSRALESGDFWNQEILKDPDKARQEAVLRALYTLAEQQKVSLDVLGTALLRWEASEDLPYHLERDRNALPILDSQNHFTPTAKRRLLDSSFSSKPEDIAKIETQIAALPEPERHFWIFGYPLRFISGQSERPQHDAPPFAILMNGLLYRTSVLGALHWREGEKDTNINKREEKILIPSVGLLRLMIKDRFGSKGLKPKLALGITTEEEVVRDTTQDDRVLGLHFPGTTGPKEADGMHSGKFPFSLHDIYHILEGSRCNREARIAMARFQPFLSALTNKRQGSFPEMNLVIDGKEYRILPPNHLVEEALQKMVDSDLYGKDFFDSIGFALQHPILTKVDANERRVIESPDGKIFFILDVVQNPTYYERLLGEPIAKILQAIDRPRAWLDEASIQPLIEAARNPSSFHMEHPE